MGLSFGLGNLIFVADTSADSVDYVVNVDSVLTVEVTSGGVATNKISLDLNPTNHTFDAKTVDVDVATNNVTGYQLFVSTSNGSTDLARNQDPNNTGTPDGVSAVIGTLADNASGYTEDTFTANKWGYKITASTTNPELVTANYFPFVTNTNLATNHSSTNGDTTSLSFAAKIDWNQPAGAYENTLVFATTATYAAYTIDYYNGYDNSSIIASQTNAYNTSSIVPVNPGLTPARPTYDFVKWCDTLPTADSNDYFPATVCNGNSYAAGDTLDIDATQYNTNINLYAYWDPTTFDEAYAAAGKSKSGSYYVMQDMSPDICAAVTQNSVTQLTDTRSGSYTYYVAKLKDDKCWMTQNLRLGANVSSLAITSADSNVTSNFTLSKDSDGKMPYTSLTDDVTGATAYLYNGSAYYCSPVSDNSYVGCYYNWFTATAGTGTSSVTGKNTGGVGTDVNASICPKNWYLPKGGSNGDFQALFNQYPSATQMLVTGTTTVDNTTGLPQPGFLLSGLYHSGGPLNVGTGGVYWSRTAYSAGYGYYLRLNSTTVCPQNYSHKYDGFSVRCVAYGS